MYEFFQAPEFSETLTPMKQNKEDDTDNEEMHPNEDAKSEDTVMVPAAEEVDPQEE
jgi:hypothetical protein